MRLCRIAFFALLMLATVLPRPGLAVPTPVGVDTLLRQETDLSQLPRLRGWSSHMQSSYQRNGGNGDAQNFLSMDGKTAVLADMAGPGAIVRLWSANPNGQVKIYIDDNPVPVIDAPLGKLLDGSMPPFVAPLCQPSSGGFYSYLPIPYARHCRVTVDNPQGLYYHVNFLTFPPGTPVRPFALPLTARDQAAIQAAGDAWAHPENAPALRPSPYRIFSATVPRGQVKTLASYKGPGVIRLLQMNLPDADDRTLRQVVLRAYFDGHKTPDIEAPVADFFGNAFGRKAFTSLLLDQQPNGVLEARFPMPFGRSARWTLENGSAKPVSFGWNVVLDKTPFDARTTGYFHALWSQETTRRGLPHVWAKAQGQRGQFVGIVQTMAAPTRGLGFLEGDEQFRVDSEHWLPSEVKSTVIGPWNGTGTEDCFNSGWYFSGGPNALPVNGALVRSDRGQIDVYRWFLDDAPVFGQSLDAQIEHGGVNDAPGVYYSSVAYWYSDGPAQAWAQMPPASTLDLPPIPPPAPVVPNAIEGESLVNAAKVTFGKVQTQDMSSYGGLWSGDSHLWWTGAKPGDTLTLPLTPPAAGTYDLIGYFTKAGDYGQFTFAMNGAPLPTDFDAYHDGVVPSGPITLGRVTLPAGPSNFVVIIKGKNPAATNTLFGLDALVLKRAPG